MDREKWNTVQRKLEATAIEEFEKMPAYPVFLGKEINNALKEGFKTGFLAGVAKLIIEAEWHKEVRKYISAAVQSTDIEEVTEQ